MPTRKQAEFIRDLMIDTGHAHHMGTLRASAKRLPHAPSMRERGAHGSDGLDRWIGRLTPRQASDVIEELLRQREGTKQNPAASRLRYIAKQFPSPYPLYWAIRAALEVQGIHVLDVPTSYNWRDKVRLSNDEWHEELVAFIDENEHRLGSSPYDRYLPWVASQVNKIYKSAFKATDFQEHRFREAESRSARLSRLLRSIGEWAQAEGVDLGRVNADDALLRSRVYFQRASLEREVPQGRVVLEFPDGYTVQELTTEEELDAEGDAMGHCVGEYCEEVRGGDVQIFSLRDPDGQPHVTMEFNPETNSFVQIRGKQNVEPKERYWPYIGEFIIDMGAVKTRPPEDLVTYAHGIIDEVESISGSAKRANELMLKAADLFKKGRLGAADDAATEASRIENQYGDDPVTGFVRMAVEDGRERISKYIETELQKLEDKGLEISLDEDDDVSDFYAAPQANDPRWYDFYQGLRRIHEEETEDVEDVVQEQHGEWTGLDWEFESNLPSEYDTPRKPTYLVDSTVEGETAESLALKIAKYVGAVNVDPEIESYVEAAGGYRANPRRRRKRGRSKRSKLSRYESLKRKLMR